MNTKQQYRNRLNSILEGIQIIDFEWRYVYLNDISVEQSKIPTEELLGFTMMEKYPGIENTELFKILQLCMEDRQTRRVENEFTFPDNSVQWFDLRVQPVEEGICILSLDITQQKLSEAKFIKGKDLYAFLSHINQSIVHLTNPEALFGNACKVALDFGKFKVAWIGLFSETNDSINLVEQCGLKRNQISYFKNATLSADSPQRQVLKTGNYFSCNDLKNNGNFSEGCDTSLDIQSFIVLPLRKSGKIIGTFNLYSELPHFTGPDEIALLQEVTDDISFALQNYENEKTHRETERTVIENEKRFRALIEKSMDMKTLATKEGKLFYGSPAITKVLGYNIEEMANASIFDLIHPDDLGLFSEKREALLKKPGSSFPFEMRMKHFEGHWIWTEGVATNLLKESGVHAVVSNFRDITQKKIAEQQAEFDRNNTNALINNTSDLMWSFDKNLKLITSNTAFDDLSIKIYGTALHKGEFILRDGMPASRRKQFEKLYQKALSGKVFRQIVSFVLPDGNWSEIAFSPIFKGEEIIGVACHSRDVTERMKAEMALEKQNKELTKTNFELDRFVYSVSHDLRSPLTSILGLVSFIEEESKEADTLEHAKMIKNGIDRLDGFIKNILSYSRNNRTKTEVVRIHLTETVNNIIEILRHSKDANEIHFEVNFDESHPFCSDMQGFYTILENSVSNAIKFRNKDSDQSTIKITGTTSAAFLDMKIEDSGIGIPKEHLEKIFEMFFRSSAKIEGSGIGLYIVKEIISKLGGTITVESEIGEGTVFHIRLKNLKP